MLSRVRVCFVLQFGFGSGSEIFQILGFGSCLVLDTNPGSGEHLRGEPHFRGEEHFEVGPNIVKDAGPRALQTQPVDQEQCQHEVRKDSREVDDLRADEEKCTHRVRFRDDDLSVCKCSRNSP